jgi:hypothetical protein
MSGGPVDSDLTLFKKLIEGAFLSGSDYPKTCYLKASRYPTSLAGRPPPAVRRYCVPRRHILLTDRKCEVWPSRVSCSRSHPLDDRLVRLHQRPIIAFCSVIIFKLGSSLPAHPI